MKNEFSRQIFEKSSNIKFHENPSSGSPVVPFSHAEGHTQADGRADRHVEANSRFPQFY